MSFEFGDVVYRNPLGCEADVQDFRLEGDACITFPRGRMRLEQAYERDMDQCRHANFLFWCPDAFDDHIAVSWEFRPQSDAGLAMFWIAAGGRHGEDLFDPSLAPRGGDYKQYHHGDVNGLHVSYFRRNPSEIGFQTCNLRKSYGFHLACLGADPLPSARDVAEPYRMEVVKSGPVFRFSINDLTVLDWRDDGQTFGPLLGGGKIGFRQMAGLVAEYANLEVRRVARAEG